jgi:hypothetical protein
LGRACELLLYEAGHLNAAMFKCRKSVVITKLESCHSYCANFKNNLVFCCFSIYLLDLKLSNDPKLRLFHQYMELQYSSGQVPDYVQYGFLIAAAIKKFCKWKLAAAAVSSSHVPLLCLVLQLWTSRAH